MSIIMRKPQSKRTFIEALGDTRKTPDQSTTQEMQIEDLARRILHCGDGGRYKG